mmetsp:Transcript_3366/g.2323  ORF Transcript_3366/g.2323 Transcript_3366/m.2323 type:complete len:118 (-) Transcript_3366:147-500(-)
MVEQISKKISEMQKLLRSGEDKGQESMLLWENFVIQQEKMMKLREDIEESFSVNSKKLDVIVLKNTSLQTLINHLSRVAKIAQTCQDEVQFSPAVETRRHEESLAEIFGLSINLSYI